MSDAVLCAGAARVCITPLHEVDLYSFDGVQRSSARVEDDLFANVVCFAYGGHEALVVSLDLIWVPSELANAVRDWVVRERGCEVSDVMVCATHAHSTPQLWEGCFNFGRPDAAYARFVEQSVREASRLAWDRLEECEATYGTAQTGLSVYRRKRILDLGALKRGRICRTVANRPDFDRPCDDVLSVLWLRSLSGRKVAALVNWACHPTLHRGDALCSDYPGHVAQLLIDRHGPDFVPCFLQGFSGNVKAALIKRLSAPLSDPARSLYYLLFDRYGFQKDLGVKERETFATKLADAVDGVHGVRPLTPSLSSAQVEVKLPHERVELSVFEAHAASADPQRAAYGSGMLRDAPNGTPLRIHRLTLGHGVSLVGMDGEIFCEYAVWLRRVLGAVGMGVMPVGCAGGMVGYIPDSAALGEGGYEVDRCLMEFGLPSRFSPGVERCVKDGVCSLFADIST